MKRRSFLTSIVAAALAMSQLLCRMARAIEPRRWYSFPDELLWTGVEHIPSTLDGTLSPYFVAKYRGDFLPNDISWENAKEEGEPASVSSETHPNQIENGRSVLVWSKEFEFRSTERYPSGFYPAYLCEIKYLQRGQDLVLLPHETLNRSDLENRTMEECLALERLSEPPKLGTFEDAIFKC